MARTRSLRRAPEAGADVSRLARLACEHLERLRLYDQVGQTLGTLQRTGIWVVVGEARLLATLQSWLQEAGRLLHELSQDLDGAKLGRLADLLADPAWNVA